MKNILKSRVITQIKKVWVKGMAINRLKNIFIKNAIPIRIKTFFKMYPFLKFILVITLYYLLNKYWIYIYNYFAYFSMITGPSWGINLILTIFDAIFSITTILLFFLCLVFVASYSRFMSMVSFIIGIIFYIILVAYEFRTTFFLNGSVVINNFKSTFATGAFSVMRDSLDMEAITYIPVFILLFLYFEYKYSWLLKHVQRAKKKRRFLASIIIYIVCLMSPFGTMDPIASFFRSFNVKIDKQYQSNIILKGQSEYPFLIKSNLTQENDTNVKEENPHIFIVLFESLNYLVLDSVNEQGIEYTPFLNQLRSKSVHFPRFYGNSVSTAKGHFSTLFSAIPSINQNVFSKYADVRFQSLATILKKRGYETIVFSASNDRNFDNTSNMLTHNGFDRFVTPKDLGIVFKKEDRLSWGPKDEVFIDLFFDTFKKEINQYSKPKCFILLTIANHYPFTSVLKKDQKIYKNPTTINKNYANSVRLTDDGVRRFYKRLTENKRLYDNSLVFITADHSYPIGEKKTNETRYNEDSFRIPFYMMWPKKIKNQIIDTPASQMDILPTIVDLLNIKLDRYTFQGRSVFKREVTDPVYLIQPYGKHLCVIKYPLKYRYYTKSSNYYAYDLKKDPLEQKNIWDELSDDKKNEFYQHLKVIYLNSIIISQNRFWPKQ